MLAQSDPGSLGSQLATSLEGSLASGQLWVALVAAWVGGLLTALTPCVYPLIPITIRYFGGMQQSARSRVVGLALTYVGGMVMLTFTPLMGMTPVVELFMGEMGE